MDNNVNQFGQLTLLVVILKSDSQNVLSSASCILAGASEAQYTYVGFPGVSSDLRQQQVDSERGILIMQSVLDGTDLEIGGLIRRCSPVSYWDFTRRDGTNLLSKNLGGVTVSTDDT